jgi:monoamine oxidase
VHFACLLKQSGYESVQIVEAAPQLGGKCLTRFLDGVPHEVGFAGNILR